MLSNKRGILLNEYIEQAKSYYAQEIVKRATDLIKTINTRYTEILIENGYEFVTLGKPQRGSSRPSVSNFIENHKSDIIVMNLADYFLCTGGTSGVAFISPAKQKIYRSLVNMYNTYDSATAIPDPSVDNNSPSEDSDDDMIACEIIE